MTDDIEVIQQSKYCKHKTDNVEMIANDDGELLITLICEECFEKLKLLEEI